MKRITITLTEDQASTIVHVLDWAYAGTTKEEWADKRRLFPKEQVDQWVKEEQAHDAFLRRIQQKIRAELVKL